MIPVTFLTSCNGVCGDPRVQFLRSELGQTLRCSLCSRVLCGLRVKPGHWLKSHPDLSSSVFLGFFLHSLTLFSLEHFLEESVALTSLAQGLLLGKTGLRHFPFTHKTMREMRPVQGSPVEVLPPPWVIQPNHKDMV